MEHQGTLVKGAEDKLTLEMVKGLLGKYVYVPTNNHERVDVDGNKETINVWFGGRIVGFEQSTLCIDFVTGQDTEPQESFAVITGDGMGFALAEDCEINEITVDIFAALVAEHQAKQILKDAIVIPTQDKKIIIPGR